jgi:WD40 repeat protein
MDNNIKIWDKNTFKLLNTLGNHTGTIFKLAVLKSGLLVSGAWDNSIIIYNNSEIVKIINDHTDYISGLIVLNNGNFVSCSFDYTGILI